MTYNCDGAVEYLLTHRYTTYDTLGLVYITSVHQLLNFPLQAYSNC